MDKIYNFLSSKVYNATKKPGDSIDGDLEYYFKKVAECDGRVLEAGVGNGRMLIPFLRRGIEIDGIDISKEMLDLCQKNCKTYNLSPNLFLGYLKDYNFENKYDLIIIPNGTICLIGNIFEIEKMLSNLYKNLNKGGRVIIDLIYPTSFKNGYKVKDIIETEKNEKVIVETFYKEMNWIEQSSLTEMNYSFTDDEEKTFNEKQNFKLYWFGLNEFKLLLEKLNFKNISYELNYGIKRNLNLKTLTFIGEK